LYFYFAFVFVSFHLLAMAGNERVPLENYLRRFDLALVRWKEMNMNTKIKFAFVVFALVAALLVSTARADGTLTWTGQGTTNGQLNTVECDANNTPYLLWIFTLGGAGNTVTSATLTLGGSGSGSYAGTQFGQEFHITTPFFDLSTLTASVAYVGSLGQGNANLVISHGCPGGGYGQVAGKKYYDANRNGQWDAGEPGLQNWRIDYTNATSGTLYTNGGGDFSVQLNPDTYTFCEQQASSPWVQTGNTLDQTSSSGGNSPTLNSNMCYTIVVAAGGSTSGVNFGNVCEVPNKDGKTLGFWSNKNGKEILSAHDPAWRTLLNGYNLRNADGSDYAVAGGSFDTAYNDFRSWLLGANATNMSYMLSVQMAATILNINYGSQDGTALVYDPVSGTWKTINALIVDADAFLLNHPTTLAGDPARDTAEKYKNIFDGLNNNTLIVTPPTPSGCSTPVFGSVSSSSLNASGAELILNSKIANLRVDVLNAKGKRLATVRTDGAGRFVWNHTGKVRKLTFVLVKYNLAKQVKLTPGTPALVKFKIR
jgi:hypothetical protein